MSLKITDLTHGVSVTGVGSYLDDLNSIAITKTQNALRNTKTVKKALQAGWQGQAELNFEKNLDSATEAVCNALDTLKTNLESLIADLEENMARHDAELVPEADDIIKF